MGRILEAWRCFSRDPAFATRAMVDVLTARMLSPFNPAYKKYESDLQNVTEESCLCIDVRSLALGTALLFALAFSAFCGVAYAVQMLFFH